MRVTATSRRRRDNRDQQSLSLPSSRSKTPTPVVAAATALCEPQVIAATAADHAGIQQLLTCCGLRTSAAEFQAQQEHPDYRPQHRLLAHAGHVLGHLRVIPQQLCFGDVRLPVWELADLAVLPEWQGGVCEAALLREAERLAFSSGAQLLVARTAATRLFQECGWIVGPRHSYSTVWPRELLSCLRTAAPPPALLERESPAPELNVRLWRRMEQDALVRLYESQLSGSYGISQRSEDHWHWLIGRRGFDRIYVAIEGPQRMGLDEANEKIHGYAVLREARIVECVTNGRPDALAHLLSRACHDALERDWHPLRIDAAPDHPLHDQVLAAQGRKFHHDADGGEAVMMRLGKPADFVRSISSELVARARRANLELPCLLGVVTDGARQRLTVNRRGARLAGGPPGRCQIACSQQDFARLLFGRQTARVLAEQDRLRHSSRSALEIASALFPQLPWNTTTWDCLPAL
jgi:GNAT superfamily N-acetyltransferase